MGIEERKVKIYTCDALGCFKETFIRPEIDTPPIGVHGRLTIVYAGGDFVEFFSCTDEPKHISDAIKGARKRDEEEQNAH